MNRGDGAGSRISQEERHAIGRTHRDGHTGIVRHQDIGVLPRRRPWRSAPKADRIAAMHLA